jgi:hypothetical protein
MLVEGNTASSASFTEELPVGIEVMKEVNDTVNIPWLNTPSTIEGANMTGRSRLARPDVK